MADEPVSRILCCAPSRKGRHAAAIIPLGHSSRCDSSSLPEGCSQRRLAPSSRERALCSVRREAVDCKSVLGEPGRLSPPIWPCTTRGFPCLRCCHRSGGLLPHLFTLAKLSERFEDVPQVFLRDATVLLSAGGIFSVALSVNSSTGFSLCAFSSRTLQNSHRGKNAAQTQVCATAPLALPGALPFTLRPRGAEGFIRHRLLRAYDDGVRTFLPPSHLAMAKPAITRLTRQHYCIAVRRG